MVYRGRLDSRLQVAQLHDNRYEDLLHVRGESSLVSDK